jgi:RNA polymerase sigma factor (sigma-70 family)
MAQGGLRRALEHVRRALAPAGEAALTDAQLLARFVAGRDECAFAALLRRHGPMVLGVCRRLLRHEQDAEDAFQATFLVLARKAGSVVKRESVGGWLYGVSCRTALKARGLRCRRAARETQVTAMPEPEVAPAEVQDWRPWLDLELSRLPEKYRAVLVACDLEGLSRREAARQLKLAEGTLSSRLARGRCMLARRLARYGLSVSGGALAAALAEGASAAVPAPLLVSTVKCALGQAAGIAPAVTLLMKEVLRAMLIAKLKLAVGAVVVLAALGASGLAYRAAGQAPAAAKQAQARPLSELELLRKEVDILKLQVDLMQEKVRAQGEELRALRAEAPAKAKPLPAVDDNTAPLQGYYRFFELRRKEMPADPTLETEAALKALREAKDEQAKRRAADDLEKAARKLRDQLKPADPTAPQNKERPH